MSSGLNIHTAAGVKHTVTWNLPSPAAKVMANIRPQLGYAGLCQLNRQGLHSEYIVDSCKSDFLLCAKVSHYVKMTLLSHFTSRITYVFITM